MTIGSVMLWLSALVTIVQAMVEHKLIEMRIFVGSRWDNLGTVLGLFVLFLVLSLLLIMLGAAATGFAVEAVGPKPKSVFGWCRAVIVMVMVIGVSLMIARLVFWTLLTKEHGFGW